MFKKLRLQLGLAMLLGGSCSLAAQTIPWVLPWDDATPGITDLAGLNAPIGPARVTADANGHFTVSGERIRFLGMNLAGDSPFMPTNHAEAVAARLAKFGLNAVRLHHMDSSWAVNGGLLAYTDNSSTNFNPESLARLHFLVARLKAHGIYSDVNLLVGRTYRAGDGLGAEAAGMDWKSTHVLGFFYEPALALQQDYANKLLAPTNPFTGLSLARDPAVAFVEILNENGIIQNWLEGSLDRLPARYATVLQARWNRWLAARYASADALRAAWHANSAPLGANLLANGAFTNGLAGWNPEQHERARASFDRTFEFTDGQPCARVNVTATGAAAWHVQLNYPGLEVASNRAYAVSFWAKASRAATVEWSLMQAHGDYSNLGAYQPVTLTTNWQHFTETLQTTAGDANARLNFGAMGDQLATFWFADVSLQPGGTLAALPPGAAPDAGTVPNVRHASGGATREARRDWLAFLRDLEDAYYDAMTAFLRTNIGYPGLVFGTILANSPATVQSRLDVVDGHAYWQHPEFPGQAWDARNWRQRNISMVNTLGDGNTLAGLARQRVQGKPFTVTEYQHPAPNYYGAEGPLLLAAYAALQDWDGLWLFAYGPGNPAGPLGYVADFFSSAQHPTLMPNLLLAANLFRRGDVQPAREALTMALTPDRELDLLGQAGSWSVFSSRQLGVPAAYAFTQRLATSVGANPTGASSPPPKLPDNLLTSDTGELRWDVSRPGRGLVTIDTPRTKALVGFADNRPIALGGLTLEPAATRLGWCTLGITLMRGESFTNNSSALVVAGGWWENTGQAWTDTNKVSVGTHWGRAPVLAEVVPFRLTLPAGTNRVTAWALDPTGRRKTSLPLTGDAAASVLTVGPGAGSMWYEVEVAR